MRTNLSRATSVLCLLLLLSGFAVSKGAASESASEVVLPEGDGRALLGGDCTPTPIDCDEGYEAVTRMTPGDCGTFCLASVGTPCAAHGECASSSCPEPEGLEGQPRVCSSNPWVRGLQFEDFEGVPSRALFGAANCTDAFSCDCEEGFEPVTRMTWFGQRSWCRPSVGTACTDDSECASGWCPQPESQAEPRVCAASKPFGSPCGEDKECTNKHCVSNVCCLGPCTGDRMSCVSPGQVGTCTCEAGYRLMMRGGNRGYGPDRWRPRCEGRYCLGYWGGSLRGRRLSMPPPRPLEYRCDAL